MRKSRVIKTVGCLLCRKGPNHATFIQLKVARLGLFLQNINQRFLWRDFYLLALANMEKKYSGLYCKPKYLRQIVYFSLFVHQESFCIHSRTPVVSILSFMRIAPCLIINILHFLFSERPPCELLYTWHMSLFPSDHQDRWVKDECDIFCLSSLHIKIILFGQFNSKLAKIGKNWQKLAEIGNG